MNDGEDLINCAQIEYDCWREIFSPMLGISEYIYYLTPAKFEKEIRSFLNTTYSHIVKIYDSHLEIINRTREVVYTLTGFAIISTRQGWADEYIIDKFFVSPKYQGKGIGQKLLEKVIESFSDKPISISVFEQNRIAQHILLKNNFRRTTARESKLTYGKNAIDIKNVYYKLDNVEENNERNIL